MPAWNRNEPVAAKRRALMFVYDIDGQPAPATTLFTGTNELLVDKGDGVYIAPGGTLSTTNRPLTFSDLTITAVDTSAETVTSAAHGLLTGDGPVNVANTGGALPGGLAAATPYWIIKVDVDKVAFATSLANALADMRVNLTSAGSGTNKIVAIAGTKRLNDGLWMYESSQAELNYRGTYFGIRIAKTNFKDSVLNVDLRDEQQIHAGTAAAGAAGTITLDGAASGTNDTYKDMVVIIVGGLGVGQVNTIASYAGGTKVATMARNWATNPDNTSQFVIVPAPSGANPTSVAAAVWSQILEGTYSAGDLVRLIVGIFAGTISGYDSGSIVAKSLNGAKTRITWTVDQTGRLTLVIGDLT